MNKKKKILMSAGILAGILLIVSTAFADSLNKTAYEQLKDTVKHTAQAMTGTITSNTVRTTVEIRDNGAVLFTMTETAKYDRTGGCTETSGLTQVAGQDAVKTYSYSDGSGTISYDASSDTYYVSEYSGYAPGYDSMGDNPFESEQAADLEKIFDALVGNLQNYVVLKVNPDGSREFSGSLTDAQIPALINAIVSFAGKQVFSQYSYAAQPVEIGTIQDPRSAADSMLPALSGDIAIKSISGKASVDADGLMTEISAGGVITGVDKDGAVHDLSAEVLVRMQDIGTTAVTKPDLTGENVVMNKDVYVDPDALSPKFAGTYRNDIITETPEAFVKIGERVLVIREIADGRVRGSYEETYLPGYEDRLNDCSSFEFDVPSSDPYSVMLQFTDKAGIQRSGSIYFDTNSYTVQMYLDNETMQKNAVFNRVFD